MASQEFTVHYIRYVPGPIVRYNGIKGRFWEERVHRLGGWIQSYRKFYPLCATRRDIMGWKT